MNKKFALFGAGGHAREVAAQIGKPVTFFVDDQYVNRFAKPISSFDPTEYYMMVAVADPLDRENIVAKLHKETEYFSFVHQTAIILDDSCMDIGVGTFIGAYSILTTNIRIGKHAILNRGVQIGHDCIIGDYFSAMPGAIVSGNCSLGHRVFMGTNSSIREKLSIGNDMTLGMGSCFVKDCMEVKGMYVGVPAKLLTK